jgi:hypothetical protein
MGASAPDLIHLMGRDTIASGAAPNTPEKVLDHIEKTPTGN